MKNNWPIKKLGEIASVTMGQSPPSSTYNSDTDGLPFFQGKAEFSHLYPCIKKYCSKPIRIAEANDILLSVRAPVGPINIANKRSCIGRGLCAIRADRTMTYQQYIYYILKQKENNWNGSTGSTFQSINRNIIEDLEIMLPPLEIQKKIVERLDAIKKAQELNDLQISKTDELFESVAGKFFTNDWPLKSIGDISNVESGGTPDTKIAKYWAGDILWLTPKELSGHCNQFINQTERKITDEGLKNSSVKLLPVGTVLLTSRAPIGYVTIASKEISTNQGFKNIICDDNQIVNEFLYFWLKTHTSYLQSFGHGATFKEINKTDLIKIEIPVPPLSDQQKIVTKLNAVQNYKKLLLKQKVLLQELFDSVLYKSMNGEL